ncbi:MAG: hypothetical protein ACOYOB_14300 [Myxococcota bacterium]|jgi:hypothetical protein
MSLSLSTFNAENMRRLGESCQTARADRAAATSRRKRETARFLADAASARGESELARQKAAAAQAKSLKAFGDKLRAGVGAMQRRNGTARAGLAADLQAAGAAWRDGLTRTTPSSGGRRGPADLEARKPAPFAKDAAPQVAASSATPSEGKR